MGVSVWKILAVTREIESIYYPALAIFAVPANLATIGILSRGKCGLSRCVTRYLVAMAAADLLVILFDLILRQMPIVYQMLFFRNIHLCNIHAVLLYAVTDCSVWFTVMFTFDRLVAICCRKLKPRYCREKTATAILGAITLLSCLKNIFWYFMFASPYSLGSPCFCYVHVLIMVSNMWATIEFLHFILTPVIPIVLIVIFNMLTVRHIVVASRARRRLGAQRSGRISEMCHRDREIESRRKSILLLLLVSGNFIVLWAVMTLCSILGRMQYLVYYPLDVPPYVREIGYMLQMLSCCTNTCIYSVTQTKFREQLLTVFRYPLFVLARFIRH